MAEFKCDTYCGLYCGACDIMAVLKKAREENRQAKWDDLPLELRKNLPASKTADIVCYGCKSDTVFIGCSKCLIRKCAKEKMHVETCFDCRKFPCIKYRVFAFVRKLWGKKLPHLKAVPRNQLHLRELGLVKWLKHQEELWQCPRCRTAFTWYAKTCAKCGCELDAMKDYNN